MRRVACLAVIAALGGSGCALGFFGAPGPGGSGVKRKHDSGVAFNETGRTCDGAGCTVYGYTEAVPGFTHVGGTGVSVDLGEKMGVAAAGIGARGKTVGLATEPRFDLNFIPTSDRWSLTLGLGWNVQWMFYDDADVVFSSFAPSLTAHYGIVRRLNVFAGLGYSFGKVSITPDGGDEMSEGANQARALGGLSLVFRRTPRMDAVVQLEGSVFATSAVSLPGASGSLNGFSVTIATILAFF